MLLSESLITKAKPEEPDVEPVTLQVKLILFVFVTAYVEVLTVVGLDEVITVEPFAVTVAVPVEEHCNVYVPVVGAA